MTDLMFDRAIRRGGDLLAGLALILGGVAGCGEGTISDSPGHVQPGQVDTQKRAVSTAFPDVATALALPPEWRPTFVGLVPKVPFGGGDPNLCPFYDGIFMDDEDSGNSNKLFVSSGGDQSRKNVAIGGLGRTPGSSGGDGRNSVVSYCQVPIWRLPQARLSYAVLAAEGENAGTTSLGRTKTAPICPDGSYPFTRWIKNQNGGDSHAMSFDLRRTFPNTVFPGQSNAWNPIGGSIIFPDEDNVTVFHFCYVAGTGDPADSDLPNSFWVYDMNGGADVADRWHLQDDFGDHFLFVTDLANTRIVFEQDDEDDVKYVDGWSYPSWVPASAVTEMTRFVQITPKEVNTKWNFGWRSGSGFVDPQIAEAASKTPSDAQPACGNPFLDLSCAVTWAKYGAKVWSAIH